jgi:hypothetical protein
VSDVVQPSCKPYCEITEENNGDDGCPEGDICLSAFRIDRVGLCFEGCTPFIDPAENGCDRDGLKTCLHLGGGRAEGACLDSGTKPAGAECDLIDNSVLGDCEPNVACDPDREADDDTGTCAPICDPWFHVAETPNTCTDGELCGLFGINWGLCTSDVANPPIDAFSPCTTRGQFCSQGVNCFQADQQGNNLCIPYCRPGDAGAADCPDGSECTYGFFRDDVLGLCVQQ